MARGARILVSSDPKGVFREVTVVGTPKPGTCMTPVPGTAIDGNGIISMEPAGTSAGLMAADGDRIPVAVLLGGADATTAVPPGKTSDDAYVTGERGTVYFPIPGEELNVLFQNQSGTADDVVVGTTKLIIDDGTGKILPTTGSPEAEPFVALESVTDPTADQLVHCMFTGY